MRNTKSIFILVTSVVSTKEKALIGTILLVCKVHYHTKSYATLYTLGTAEIPPHESHVIYA